MEIPSPISKVPSAFRGLAERINFLLAFAKIVRDAQGKNGIKILVTDQNMVIENDPDGGDADGAGGTTNGGGGGLPPGYTFEEFTICDSGTPATRWIPTWTSNPEA